MNYIVHLMLQPQPMLVPVVSVRQLVYPTVHRRRTDASLRARSLTSRWVAAKSPTAVARWLATRSL